MCRYQSSVSDDERAWERCGIQDSRKQYDLAKIGGTGKIPQFVAIERHFIGRYCDLLEDGGRLLTRSSTMACWPAATTISSETTFAGDS